MSTNFIWCTPIIKNISQNLAFFAVPDANLLLAPFTFPRFFNILSLPLEFHCVSGCPKKLVVNYGKSLEMVPRIIMELMCHFITILAPKLITLVFNLLPQNAEEIKKIESHADRCILALLSACQEYLVKLKLMS